MVYEEANFILHEFVVGSIIAGKSREKYNRKSPTSMVEIIVVGITE